MPLTIGTATGDGVTRDLINVYVMLPDTNGGTVHVEGRVQRAGLASVQVLGDVTAPAAPGSGSIFWIIEADQGTGALTVLQSTVAMPAPDPTALLLFQQTLAAGATDSALVSTDAEPNKW